MNQKIPAYVVATGIRIEPFGDLARESLILDRPWQERQEHALREAGCEIHPAASLAEIPVSPGPYLVVADNLFFSRRLLEEFLHQARAMEGTSRIQLKKGLFTRLLAVIQETPEDADSMSFPLWYVNGGAFVPDTARRIRIDVDEDSYEGNFPPHMIGKETYRFCVTSRPMLLLQHPLHIALANLAANFARLAELKRMSVWKKLWTVAKARSLNKFRILAATSDIHPEAEVHPTAVIEGSVVEKGAKIGAYAVVRFSYVGEKAFIDDHAGLKFSIVGREAYIANNCVLFFSTVYPRAFLISGPYQFTLFGYDTALMNAIPSDFRLDAQTISVKTSSGVKNTGLRFVGSVIGHRSKIAAGIIIAPGRMIPNDLLIFPDPARVIQKVPENLPAGGAYQLVNGELIPISRSSEGRAKEKHAA